MIGDVVEQKNVCIYGMEGFFSLRFFFEVSVSFCLLNLFELRYLTKL